MMDEYETSNLYDLNKPIHKLFEEQVERTPNLSCVHFQKRELTYAEVNEKSNILARYINSLGINVGDFIAVALPRSENLIVAILSVLKLNCIYVPVDLSNPVGRLKFILEDAEPGLIITTEESGDLIQSCFTGKIVFINEDILTTQNYLLPTVEKSCDEVFSGENIAYVIYTSGSTGNPKGVCCTHKGLLNRICWMRDHYQIASNDKILHKTPIGFDVSLWELFLPLITGACLVVVPPDAHKDNQAIMDIVETECITVVHFVPSMFRAFLQSSEFFDSCVSLRYVFCSGEALSLDVAKLFFEKFSKFSSTTLHNLYGPTEAAIDVSYFECRPEVVESLGNSIPIGKPIINTQLYILDEYLKPVSALESGELYIGGVGLAKEYLKRSDLTQKQFLPNPFGPDRIYRTGDIAVRRPDGNIEFLGRKDTQVKIRGYRIELGEIEMNLMKIPGVINAAVIVRDDLILNSKVIVGYIHRRAQGISAVENEMDFSARVNATLNSILPSYMIPSKYVFMEEFPLTLSGKLDRKALPKPMTLIDGNNLNNLHQPRTEMENVLMKIWCQVMGLDELGIRDNFFQIGGDSIISMQVRSLAKDYGVQLSVRDIFDYPTIQQLSSVLGCRSRQQNEFKENDFLCEAFGEIPLTPIQIWFFEQEFENINYWNQSVVLKPNISIEEAILQKSLIVLAKSHAILNTTYEKVKENGKTFWVQHCNEYNTSNSLPKFLMAIKYIKDIKFESEKQKHQVMEEQQNEIVKAIDIQSGVLWGVTLFEFECDNEVEQRIVFFAHHLVMDGVSLRIIVSDLENAYHRIREVNALTHTENSHGITSFRKWSVILREYGNTIDFSTEIEYWTTVLESSKGIFPLFENLTLPAGQATYNVQINSHLTHNLIHKANLAYKTEINDILLTAFAIVISEWTGQQKVLLELEGHGREELIKIGNHTTDLTKTVGWFTTMFPVCLQIEKQVDLGYCLKMIKEQLRKIPHRGIHYGILRYLKKCPEFEILKGGTQNPDLCFNYLGQFDNVLQKNHWAVIESKDCIAEENHLHKSIIVDSSVCAGILEVSWRYRNCISASLIENLAKKFAFKLEEIINHCCSESSFGYSPSDFPLIIGALDQKIVDENFGCIPGILDVLPLSSMQSGMYFQTFINPESDNYIVQKVYEIKGNLKIDIFEQSWNRVVSHYDILRTGYKMIDSLGIPVQFVLSFAEIQFQCLDWSTEASSNRDTKVAFQKSIFDERRKLFSLQNPPPIRILIVKMTSNDFLLLWTMHHISLDGWSTEIIFKSVLSSYEQFLLENCQGIPYPPSFRENISWLCSQQRENKQQALKYFKTYLQDYFPTCSLTSLYSPLARHQKITTENKFSYSFDNVACKISKELLGKLKDVASLHHVTLSTLIELTWGILLARLTGEYDIVFGLTVSGRNESQNYDIVGLLINTLPVRIRFDQNSGKLGAQLQKLQKDIRILEEYSYVSLAEIQSESLKHLRSVSSDSDKLFDTILIFENYSVECLHNEIGIETSCVETIESTEYPLSVSLSFLANGEMCVCFNYKRQLFLPNHVHSISDSFHNLLEDIGENCEKSWKELNILSNESTKQFLQSLKGAVMDYGKFSTVLDLILETMERIPNSLAIIDGDRNITYKNIFTASLKIATYIKSLTPNVKGKLFAIVLERSAELIFAIVAVWLLGGVYIPIDISTPSSRIKFILDDTQSIAVLTVKSLESKFTEFNGHFIYMDESFVTFQESENMILSKEIAEKNVHPSDIAYVIYTSGSTGNPKGCMITHDNLTNYLLWARQQYFSSENIFSNSPSPFHSSVSFDLSITSIFLPLISGKTMLIAADSLGVVGLLNVLRKHKEFSVLKLTPSHLDFIYGEFQPPESLPKVGCLVIGGENLLSSQIQRWRLEQSGTKIFNEFGPTECTVGCTAFEVTMNSIDALSHSIPIGRPIDNTSVYVLDKEMNFVPKFVLGELYVGGKGVSNGYLNLPEKTKNNFIENPFGEGLLYRTGDIVRYNDDFILEYLGRSDRQVKIRGYRIELGEVEASLRNVHGISEGTVILHDGELCAFVVSKDKISKTDIISQLQLNLPRYMVPTNITFLEKLPVASSGKINTSALQKYFIEVKDSKGDTEISQIPSELETQLVVIWKEILDVEVNKNITNQDNFFELGGHSLTALRFMHIVKTRLGISFPLSKIFEIPTVKEFAIYLEKQDSPAQSAQSLKHLPQCIVTVNKIGDQTPMFLVHSGFGFATEYLSLAELDPNRPVYGINSLRFSSEFTNALERGIDFNEFSSIEDMANCYVENLLCVRCDGPFIVGGWSFGGVVALEMAHILIQKGKEVELVLLLDSFNNRNPSMQKGYEDIAANFPTLSVEERNLIYRELECNCKLLKNHIVKSIPDQKVILIKAKQSGDVDLDEENHNGWKGIIPLLTVINIPASHYDMFRPDYIKCTLVALQKVLGSPTFQTAKRCKISNT